MRHQSRETAFKIIYQIDMGKNDLETALRCTMENDGLTQQEQAFCQELVRAVEEHLIEIDEIIQRNTVGWYVERMMSVDRNLLRMAVYEMLYSAHISPKGAINEVLELAKIYGKQESSAFINSVLDKVLKTEEKRSDLVTEAARAAMAHEPTLSQAEPQVIEREVTAEEADALLHGKILAE